MRRQFSIEGVIVASAAVLFALLGFFLYSLITENALRAADEAFDRVLGAAALSIADTAAFENGAVTVDIPYSAFAILGTSRLNRIFYRVVAPDRSLVTGSPVLALDLPPAQGPDLRFADGRMQDEAIRIAAVGRYRSDAVTGEAGWVEVLVAETREAREQLAGQLAVEAAMPAGLTAVAAFLLIWVGIRFAFSPLRSVERSLRLRSPADLTPIAGRVPREVDALVIALNEFMSRLESTLEGLRRVTSDAAHQLRTPLAAIRAQSEIALEDDDRQETFRRLQRINHNAVSASVLVNRWLTDATLLHKLKTRHAEPVDLGQHIGKAMELLHADGLYKAQLAGIEVIAPSNPVIVLADPVSLAEMIRNLIENALLHAPGEIQIMLEADDATAHLSVVDQGPGIPPERYDAVFERFERNTSIVPGSGLGLSIARDVARASGGSIALSPNPLGGLRVSVSLPLHTRPIPDVTRARRGIGSGRAMALLVLAMSWLILPSESHAQAGGTPVSIASNVSPERFAPVQEALAQLFPQADFVYRQARSSEIAAWVRARTGEEPDIVILPSPDIAVSLTNDGLAARLDIADIGPDRHWRHELYVIGHDPAVIAFGTRVDALSVPQSRFELAQLLEQSPTPLFRRIGIANVGIDSVSYILAAQDSLRSPLYWRLASAFGGAQARIRDTSEELVAKIERGEIDIAYNVPLSTITSNTAIADVGFVYPQDYVLATPWVMFAPKSTLTPLSREVAGALLHEELRPALSRMIGAMSPAGEEPLNLQTIDLGPELLVFLDAIKRGTFLDTWFRLITTP